MYEDAKPPAVQNDAGGATRGAGTAAVGGDVKVHELIPHELVSERSGVQLVDVPLPQAIDRGNVSIHECNLCV